MYKRGTQSFFFHLPMVIFFLLAIILIGAIVFGIAREQGLVSYSPPLFNSGTVTSGCPGSACSGACTDPTDTGMIKRIGQCVSDKLNPGKCVCDLSKPITGNVLCTSGIGACIGQYPGIACVNNNGVPGVCAHSSTLPGNGGWCDCVSKTAQSTP